VSPNKIAKIDFDIPILLAESDPADLADLKQILEELQFRNVKIAKDGYEALQEEESKKYELVLISGALEKIHPLKLIAAFRASGANVSTPIVYTYRRRERNLLDEAMKAGANASLHKPSSEKELRPIVEDLLKGYVVSKSDQRRRSEELLTPMTKAVERGKQLVSEGAFSGAEETYEEAIIDLFCGLIEVYLYKNQIEHAERLLREAERLEVRVRDRLRSREASYIRRGNECIKNKGYLQAKEEFQVAVMIDEKSLEAHVGLVEALVELGEDEKAMEVFDRGMGEDMTANDGSPYGRLCILARRLNRFDLAHQAIDRAVLLEPKKAGHHYIKALIFMAQKNFEEALSALNKCIAISPLFSEARATQRKIETWLKTARSRK